MFFFPRKTLDPKVSYPAENHPKNVCQITRLPEEEMKKDLKSLN